MKQRLLVRISLLLLVQTFQKKKKKTRGLNSNFSDKKLRLNLMGAMFEKIVVCEVYKRKYNLNTENIRIC
jgi:hypothetical protein